MEAIDVPAVLDVWREVEPPPIFMGIPERWMDDPHWRCPNEHVSDFVLRSEMRGSLCLECMKPLWWTFPEDRDGPVPVPLPS